ncbi:phage sipho_tail superfamily [Weissella oryzae SG25]|uniref:Phage sipho_tail superfamily n=1 Tax=Weissella oryzae (strain DSM 25784 / JCM 18191 / LMG 30913 / SG25) TaxID=1329250 RepID=A0A069CSK4_WEIOS|nr:phage tail domain-containing protein [Weissella oryzae]GAK30223.1 phage sipho_tail superfamily [Weissella oryzae SG25]
MPGLYGSLYIKLDGRDEFDLTARLPNVHFLNLQSTAPAITPDWLTIAGSDGQRLKSVSFGATTITLSLFIKATNMAEFRLIKAELQSIFYGRTLIRLRSSFSPGKVYNVLANPVDIVPIQNSSQSLVDLTFTNPSGMAQSLVQSDKLPDLTDDLEYSMNIPIDKELKYQYEESLFDVYNPSDVAIDPYRQHHDLKITVKGEGNSFSLVNMTNNTAITVNTSMKQGDVFILNGVLPYLNNSSDVDTDFGHIELAKGENNIKITGLNNVDVTFSFPFLYF